jgi:hypothetical protein
MFVLVILRLVRICHDLTFSKKKIWANSEMKFKVVVLRRFKLLECNISLPNHSYSSDNFISISIVTHQSVAIQ